MFCQVLRKERACQGMTRTTIGHDTVEKYAPLSDFISWGTRYESVNYEISNNWSTKSLMSRIERNYCLISATYLAGLFDIFILLHIWQNRSFYRYGSHFEFYCFKYLLWGKISLYLLPEHPIIAIWKNRIENRRHIGKKVYCVCFGDFWPMRTLCDDYHKEFESH